MPGGDFRIVRGTGVPVPRSAHGSTHTSYTELAFNTGGAAWDLNRLRVGGDTARSFTKAFVWLKEREISQQLCTRCRCEGTGAVAVCMPGCLSMFDECRCADRRDILWYGLCAPAFQRVLRHVSPMHHTSILFMCFHCLARHCCSRHDTIPINVTLPSLHI